MVRRAGAGASACLLYIFCCVMLYEELKRELSFVHKVLDKRYEREYYVNKISLRRFYRNA